MKHILIAVFLILLLSCENNNSTEYTNNNSSEMTDDEREKLLKEKKERLSSDQNYGDDTFDINWGDIRFTALVPEYPDLGREGIALLENKINAMVAKYGVTGNVGNPAFVIIPAINITSKNITSTAPTMYANKYDVTFYTANILDGSIFSSATFSFKGVGESPLKAFINGIENTKIDQQAFAKLLSDGKDKALNYFESNCAKILQEAKTEAAQKNYNQAILILKTIPKEVDCYKSTGDLIEKFFYAHNAQNCNDLLAQMKAELGKQSEMGNFNPTAMSYYALIPMDAPCYKEAQNIYSNYQKKLDPNAKQRWANEEREFNLRKDKQEQDHIFALTKADLEAKAAIDGQSALLDKYKKDAEYNKLPWLRKLVHLGEWDPFDATSRINK
jgi:hypothetical protein